MLLVKVESTDDTDDNKEIILMNKGQKRKHEGKEDVEQGKR